MEVISFLIHAYSYLFIYEMLTEERKREVKWCFLLLFGVIKYIIELSTFTRYLWPFLLLTLLVLYSMCIHSTRSNLENLKYAIVAYGIDFVFSLVMACVLGIIEGFFDITEANWTYLFFGICRITFIAILHERKIIFDKIKQDGILYIGMIATIVLLISEQVIRFGYSINNYGFLDIALSCSYMVALFTTLWLLDHYKMLKIQNEYAIDNRQMSQKLHRSKEVLPLLADYVSSMDSLPDEKMRQKLQEVCHDYGKELGETDMDVALFNTTGVGLLDLLLQNKATECKRINVQMEVFVGTEIDEDMERLNVSDGELIRMMGDLLRNAIKAVQAPGSTDALILAMVARDECGNVEIQVHDSGIPFPKEVLEKLGERGNTTWGTGNGIADVVESLRRVQASLEIISESDPNDIFTKEVCIRFDGKGTVRAIGDQVSA